MPQGLWHNVFSLKREPKMTKFYIAVDFFGWAQGASIDEAFNRKSEDSRVKCFTNVYEVDGDPEMLYSIRWFLPQIEGARLVMNYDEHDEVWRKDFEAYGTVQMGDKGQLELA
jgi:hypothetical protein